MKAGSFLGRFLFQLVMPQLASPDSECPLMPLPSTRSALPSSAEGYRGCRNLELLVLGLGALRQANDLRTDLEVAKWRRFCRE